MKKADLAKSISSKLSALSKANGITFQNISTTFLIERLLARLTTDAQLAKSLVFKGGYVGLRVYNSSRYTIDLDALLLKADIEPTLKRVTKAAEKDIGDGAWFVFETQIDLKTQGEYGGIRQVFRAGRGEVPKNIGRTQTINFDIGIGDPITPGPIQKDTKELLGDNTLSWQVYPIETIVAEKLQTLIDRGGNSSRAKDIYDLHFYLPQTDIKVLATAIQKCFEFRGTHVPADIPNTLSNIDLALLKLGWKRATSSLKKAPDFDDVFIDIITSLRPLSLSGGKRK